MGDTMKAVNYQGAFKVKVEDVPKPKLEHPDDIIVKVTTAGMCLVVERAWNRNLRAFEEPKACIGPPANNSYSNLWL